MLKTTKTHALTRRTDTQFGWLIERGGGLFAVEYLTVTEHSDGELASFDWTYDHMKALRFARESDANKINAILRTDGGVIAMGKVTEHGWMPI